MEEVNEAILADIAEKLSELSTTVVRLEVMVPGRLDSMSQDLSLIRESLKDVTHTQRDHADRLTANEIRVGNLQDVNSDVAAAQARIAILEEMVENLTPVKTPWTAIVSAVVALVALAWTLLGK